MVGIVLGFCLIIAALLSGGKFYEGRVGTREILRPIEPTWIPRLLLLVVGLASILYGIRDIRQH